MTPFICERCRKIYDMDQALLDIDENGKMTYICGECDKKSRTTMSFVECAWCGEYVDESELEEVYDDEEGREVMICKKCFRDLIVPSGDTCVCCGEVIPEGRQVCLECDLKARYGSEAKNGEGIAENPRTEDRFHIDDIDFSSINKLLSIHKIIDDAMEKRDRTVSIFISAENNAVSVNVYPVDHDKVKWIYHEDADKYHFECSNCGMESEFQTAYCSSCGELMHGVRRVE